MPTTELEDVIEAAINARTRPMTLDDLRKDETSLFVVQGGSDGDHASLVRGWSGVKLEYATACIDCLDPQSVLDDAEAQLVQQGEEWSFGHNGTAKLDISFEDGWWSVARITTAPALATT